MRPNTYPVSAASPSAMNGWSRTRSDRLSVPAETWAAVLRTRSAPWRMGATTVSAMPAAALDTVSLTLDAVCDTLSAMLAATWLTLSAA